MAGNGLPGDGSPRRVDNGRRHQHPCQRCRRGRDPRRRRVLLRHGERQDPQGPGRPDSARSSVAVATAHRDYPTAPATSINLGGPTDIRFDGGGNLYIVERARNFVTIVTRNFSADRRRHRRPGRSGLQRRRRPRHQRRALHRGPGPGRHRRQAQRRGAAVRRRQQPHPPGEGLGTAGRSA